MLQELAILVKQARSYLLSMPGSFTTAISDTAAYTVYRCLAFRPFLKLL
jgi:hypothetical protein